MDVKVKSQPRGNTEDLLTPSHWSWSHRSIHKTNHMQTVIQSVVVKQNPQPCDWITAPHNIQPYANTSESPVRRESTCQTFLSSYSLPSGSASRVPPTQMFVPGIAQRWSWFSSAWACPTIKLCCINTSRTIDPSITGKDVYWELLIFFFFFFK